MEQNTKSTHGGVRKGAGRPRKKGGRADKAEAAELKRQLRLERIAEAQIRINQFFKRLDNANTIEEVRDVWHRYEYDCKLTTGTCWSFDSEEYKLTKSKHDALKEGRYVEPLWKNNPYKVSPADKAFAKREMEKREAEEQGIDVKTFRENKTKHYNIWRDGCIARKNLDLVLSAPDGYVKAENLTWLDLINAREGEYIRVYKNRYSQWQGYDIYRNVSREIEC